MRKISILLFFICAPLIVSLNAETPNQQAVQNAMIQDLESAKQIISFKYAPAQWKSAHLGWSLENAFEKSKARILDENPRTAKEYQNIFSEFLGSMQDYHVSTSFYSTEWSTFPIQAKGVNGRYFLTKIMDSLNLTAEQEVFLDLDRSQKDRLLAMLKGMEVGDELLALNGKPILEVIEQLIDENFNGDRSPTGYAFAEKNLFFRRGIMGQDVPSGDFQLTLLSEGQKNPYTVTLPWIYASEWVTNHVLNMQNEMKAGVFGVDNLKNKDLLQNPILAIDTHLMKDFSVKMANQMSPQTLTSMLSGSGNDLKQSNDRLICEDTRAKGDLPVLGKILWESNKNGTTYAYLYQDLSGNRIGYLFLPTFSEVGENAECIMNEIIRILKVFNSRADALVFDITNNTGGNLTFLYAVLSVLTNYPLQLPTHRELLIQEDVYKAAIFYQTIKNYQVPSPKFPGEKIETLSGYPLTQQIVEQIIGYHKTILYEWEIGSKFTKPLYLFGIDQIMPHPQVQFAKPLIVLTNEFNFSCADFFPAILQDNKRAKIFGKKTAGAGGYVRNYECNSQFGVKFFNLTASIGYRLDGTTIENLGVTPDISCDLTIRDLRHNYVDYIRRLNLEVKKMIK